MRENRLFILILITMFMLAGLSLEAQGNADESGAASFSGNVALTSDYVWRGVSQSNEDIAIQGGFDIEFGSFYVGTWGSNVDFAESSVDDADLELDLYLGFGLDLTDDFGLDIGLIEYLYPGTDTDLDWLEAYVNFSWRSLGLGINYSNDVFATDTDGIYLVLSYSRSLGADFELAADLGQYSFDSSLGAPDSYMTWSVGLSWSGGRLHWD